MMKSFSFVVNADADADSFVGIFAADSPDAADDLNDVDHVDVAADVVAVLIVEMVGETVLVMFPVALVL